MTITDAVDRACTLWGFGRIVQVQLQDDGGADVGVAPPSDPQRIVEYHRLDSYGTPTCECCRDRRHQWGP